MSSWYRRLFYDDFDDGSVGLSTDLGNGFASEASSHLSLYWPLGANTDWWGGTSHYAPIAHKAVELDNSYGIYYAETKLDQWVGDNHQFGGLVFWSDRDNGYRLVWSTYNNRIYVQRIYLDNGVTLTETGSITPPSESSPIYLRMYINPHPYRKYEMDVTGTLLSPLSIGFCYKIGDGSWVTLYQEALAFTPSMAGTVAGNGWGTTAAGSFGFDYLLIEQAYLDRELDASQGGTLRKEITSAEEKLRVDIPKPNFATGGNALPTAEQRPQTSAEENLFLPPPKAAGEKGAITFSYPGRSTEPKDTVSGEEALYFLLGGVPPFNPSISDGEGHPYFIGRSVLYISWYDTTNEPWHAPGGNVNYNGFGRDGYLYLSGVKQVTTAAWRTETASDDRGSRRDFPVKSLIGVTQKEIVIFDADSWPTALTVWMRFRVGADGSNYWMIGRGDNTLRQVSMSNGLFAVATLTTPWEVGCLILIDFKANNQYAANMLRNTEHWRLISGKTIADRNGNLWETFSSPLRISSSNMTACAVNSVPSFLDATGSAHYVIAGGEDGWEAVKVGGTGAVTGQVTVAKSSAAQYSGPHAAVDDYKGMPSVIFDENEWLWIGHGPFIYRNVAEYTASFSSLLQGLCAARNFDPQRHPAFTEMDYQTLLRPHPPATGWPEDYVTVSCLCSGGEYIFVGTNVGVFRVNKVTMNTRLLFSVTGYGGRGRNDVAGGGEVLGGTQPFVSRVSYFKTTESGYLVVSTFQGANSSIDAAPSPAKFMSGGRGAVTVIRLIDDYPIVHRPPVLHEDGAWAAVGVLY